MEHDLVLEGKVVGPSGVVEAEVGVSEGKVEEVRKYGLKGSRRIRAEGCLVFPGFVDIHVHMREPGWEYKEDFRTGTEAALHGGVTTVVDMPNNRVPATTRAAVAAKRVLADSKGLVGVQFYGGVDAGALEEIPKIADLVVGYKVYMAKTTGEGPFPASSLESAFRRIAHTGRVVSVHCESQETIDRATMALSGVERPDLHCDQRPPEAEVESATTIAGVLKLVPKLRANVCHASVAGTISVVKRSKAAGLRLDCEAALHHLYFNRRATLKKKMLKTNPPLRGEDDRRSLVGGLADGSVSFLVTDHAPHTEREKIHEGLSGVPGLDDYGHVVSWLVKDQGVDPLTIKNAACTGPAQFVGLRDRGDISPGMRADMTVLDLSSPERVKSEDLRTKCGWSPYEGEVFPGRVKWAVVGGEVLLDGYELVT